MKIMTKPFVTINKLADSCGCIWKGYELALEETVKGEKKLRDALSKAQIEARTLDADSSLVIFGSYARYEMLEGSDYDWCLLIDGVVSTEHAKVARKIDNALKKSGLTPPGSSGAFGNMVFSHELVHRIGGGEDSNVNLTRRMLLFLESRSFSFSSGEPSIAWTNVVSNILKRYFEEDVHFSPVGKRRVPRFLLNDLTRYWRTICVDYAAKHREQDGKKWALRNSKIRFSRKLLYAAGLAFCLSCQLDPPTKREDLFGIYQDHTVQPFIESALIFAQTPPLEYLAAFVEAFVSDTKKRKRVAEKIFGSYNDWLILLNNKSARESLEKLSHSEAVANALFKKVRAIGSDFASGLRELFFNRDKDEDQIANLSLDYVGF
jgi:hypothetical protein